MAALRPTAAGDGAASAITPPASRERRETGTGSTGGEPGAPIRRWPPIAFLVLLAGFMLCAATYSIAAPLWEASDESEHFQYVVYLLMQHALPAHLPTIQPNGNSEANQPPLYYVLAAPLAAGLDLSDAARIRLNPRMGWENDPAGILATAHLLDEGWPYHGAFLAAHRLRLLSTLLGALTLVLTSAIPRESTQDRRLALLAAAVLALLPGFLFASATIDNDALANVLGAALLLIVVAAPRLGSARATLLFGVASALALLTKLDLLPLIGLGILWLIRQSPHRQWLRACVHLTLPILPAFAYWVWRVQTGERNLVGARVTLPPPLPGSTGPLDWSLPWHFTVDMWVSLLGVFGRQNVFMPPWLYALYGIVAVGGLLFALVLQRNSPSGAEPSSRRLLWAWLAVAFLAILGRFVLLTGPRTGYDSSRFLYPALPAFATLVACGLQQIGRRWPRLVAPATVPLVGAIAGAFALPWLVIAPAYPPPFPVTNHVPPGPTAVSGGQFVNSVTLAAIQLPQTPVTAGQAFAVTFYWRVQQPLPDGDWLFIHVLNADGRTAAAFDGAPLYNTLPLSYWRHGDVVIDREILTVHGDAPAGPYRIDVGWYDQKTGVRVALANGGNELTAGSVEVRTPGP
jgi:4-amino-4-deoxy-L-arabinose transferase-like glycosyltransferase